MDPRDLDARHVLVDLLCIEQGLGPESAGRLLSTLSLEETYYWLSKCSGEKREQGIRALACLLGQSDH